MQVLHLPEWQSGADVIASGTSLLAALPYSHAHLDPTAPMTSRPAQLLFLPGASGDTGLWQPVADLLQHPAARVHVGWPGFGPTPADPSCQGFGDLVAAVLGRIDRPTALIAQSMGGAVALRAALARSDLVTHLVLAATSGGLDVAALGAVDWRAGFLAANPTLPTWFATHREDLSAQFPTITAPALLLWGDADPISPVAVGQRLAALLPHARLEVVVGGGHDLARVFAAQVAQWVDAHLSGV